MLTAISRELFGAGIGVLDGVGVSVFHVGVRVGVDVGGRGVGVRVGVDVGGAGVAVGGTAVWVGVCVAVGGTGVEVGVGGTGVWVDVGVAVGADKTVTEKLTTSLPGFTSLKSCQNRTVYAPGDSPAASNTNGTRIEYPDGTPAYVYEPISLDAVIFRPYRCTGILIPASPSLRYSIFNCSCCPCSTWVIYGKNSPTVRISATWGIGVGV